MIALLLVPLLAAANPPAVAPMTVTGLRCESLVNPLGLGESRPRLSWRLESTVRGERQTAYRVLVASSEKLLAADRGDLWDSGKVKSDASVHVAFGGPSLGSRRRAFWKVRVWDKSDHLTPWSASAWWEMGLVAPADWTAQWIALAADVTSARREPVPGSSTQTALPALPAPHLRKAFDLGKKVRRARLYATARGLYQVELNGRRVGDELLRPGWTDYKKRIQVQTYDVTERLKPGANVLGVVLGEGWYRGHVGMFSNGLYGDTVQALLQLELELDDGSTTRIVSDPSWVGRSGPILSSDLLMGEDYDARRELSGWSSASSDTTGWTPVQTSPRDGVPLVPQIGPGVKKIEELHPRSVHEQTPGVFVVDIGQNMVGWARLRVKGEAGRKVTLRFAEILNPDGSIYTTNLRAARATDSYTLNGGGPETWEPSFTFHGFRYVEVSGYPGMPGPDAITGIVASSAGDSAGSFTSSDPMVNQLQKNIVWGLRGNFLEIPTDCPQRNERLGWMGDIQVFAPTALYNTRALPFLTKWMWDVADAQYPSGSFTDFSPTVASWRSPDGAPAWADAGVMVPWSLYLHTGDARVLETHFDAMARYVDFVRAENPDLLWTKRTGNNYGDWLNIHADTPREVLATAYFANSASLVSRAAAVLGKREAAAKYAALADEIKAAFRKAFASSSGLSFRIRGDTQTAYLLALRFGLLEKTQVPWAVDRLVDDIVFARKNHLSTGFLGVGVIAPVLSEFGHTDLAYRLLTNDTFPSWGFSIKQGATTIWERWDGWTPERGFQDAGMNSFNHYALGAVGEWLYSTVAGIAVDPEQPGFKRVLLAPRPGGGLTSAKATHDSPYGEIASEWSLADGRFEWKVSVPANTTARVRVPARSDQTVTEGGQPVDKAEAVTIVGREADALLLDVGSGRYAFGVR